MTTKSNFLVALALTLPLAGASATTFTSNTGIGVGDTTYDGQEIIVSGCTLTVDGPHSFASLLLTNGAVLTHSPAPNGETNNRLNLTVTADLTVDTASRVDASGRGYGFGKGPGAGAFHPIAGSGAGHGGPGTRNHANTPGGASYGALDAPATWGSGGGTTDGSGGVGGAGGGVIHLAVTGTLRVDGQLVAEGRNGVNGGTSDGGGGSGGSVLLRAGRLAGSGIISASGGSHSAPGMGAGGGGGGRVAIYHAANDFAGTLQATGGWGHWENQPAGAGTIYLKQTGASFGELILDSFGNGNSVPTPLSAPVLYSLTVSNGAVAFFPEAGCTLAGLHVANGGTLTHAAGSPTLDLVILHDAVVEPGGAISVDGLGHAAGTGPGAGAYHTVAGSGAGHGGPGTRNYANTPGGASYGSLDLPVAMGSGGGGTGAGVIGGAGGGFIRLSVMGTLRVDGRVSANGNDGLKSGSTGGGGGSGGSVLLTVVRLAGSGIISASGGNHANPGLGAGGGGGGRVAIYHATNDFAGTLQAFGGLGHWENQPAGAGTIYLKSTGASFGEVILASFGPGNSVPTPFSTPFLFSLTVSNGAVVQPQADWTLLNLRVAQDGTLTHLAGGPPLCVTVVQDATLETGAVIALNGKGYPSDTGPGRGNRGSYDVAGTGAGHGGVGTRNWSGQAGGITYGSAAEPVDLGSGGGGAGGSSMPGGAGGGAVRMSAGGTLRVDGTITANGMDGVATSSHDSAGGSGGSIFLTAETILGSGLLAAIGGSHAGPGWGAGGGGGGRIALYALANGFTGSSQVGGGLGAWENIPAGPGTVWPSGDVPLFIISHSPRPRTAPPAEHVEVFFSREIRANTFTPDDVQITGSAGAISSSQLTITPLGGRAYRISFPAQPVHSPQDLYQVVIGTEIEDLDGGSMADGYTGGFTVESFSLSGTVLKANGDPAAGVALSLDGGSTLATTQADGSYTLTAVPLGWTGTLTPSLAGWVFTPATRTYVNLSADVTSADFTGDVSTALEAPPVLSMTRSDTTLHFTWPSVVGLRYQFQSSPNLLPDSWTDEGPPADGTGSPLGASLSIGPEPAKFFRLQASN